MFPFVYSPTYEYPLSGDVVQDIAPIVSVRYAGLAEVEHEVYSTVASPGKQLGKLCEAVLLPADKAGLKPEEHEAIQDLVDIAKGVETAQDTMAKDVVAKADAMAVKAEMYRKRLEG